jgi:hypothetical protein
VGALGDAYATPAELAERLNVDDGPTLSGLLDAASRAVEAFCHRQFNKATVATARRFRPLDWRRLPVDDFHTVTGLIVDVGGTVWDAADFDPQPWNGTVDGMTGWPFYNLYGVNRSWSQTLVTTVTAQWGWTAVPSAIKESTLATAAAMFNAGGSSYPVRSEAIDGYSVNYHFPTAGEQYPPEFDRAMPYRRKRFGIA